MPLKVSRISTLNLPPNLSRFNFEFAKSTLPTTSTFYIEGGILTLLKPLSVRLN